MDTCGEARYAASKPAPVHTHTCHAHQCGACALTYAMSTSKAGEHQACGHETASCMLYGEHAPPPMCASKRELMLCFMLWTLATAYLIIDAHCACTLQEANCTASTEHTFQPAFAVAASVLTFLGVRCAHIQRMHAQIISEVLQAALAFAQFVNVLRAQAIRNLGPLLQVIHDGLAWVRTESLQHGSSCAYISRWLDKACAGHLQTGAPWEMQTSAVTQIVRVHVGRAAAALLQCPCRHVIWMAGTNKLAHVCGTTVSVDNIVVTSFAQLITQCC